MENRFIRKSMGTLKINVTGKHIERFIKRLYTNHIDLLEITYVKNIEVNIKIYEKDLEKIKDLKSVYDIFIVDGYGLYKIKKLFFKTKYLIFSLVFGMGLFLILSHMIFEVKVIHNDQEIRALLLNELESYNIKQYAFKKNYQEITAIKEAILDKYKDEIEWLEIESVGTSYIVRVEERKIPDEEEILENRHIVSSKTAIIKKIDADTGEIVKKINDYVKPGDIIISGEIKLNEEVKDTVRAEGKVYGEVWYQVTVEYPFNYKEEKTTGKTKQVLVLSFLNKSFDLFNFNPFQNKTTKDKVLLSSNLIPLKLLFQKQKEVEIIDEVYTEEEALAKAMEIGKTKIEDTLEEDEYIIRQNNLKINLKESKIEVEMFFAVYENITSYQEIEIIVEE
ncbi:MAG: sporulation protein YqfD [Bacilli bacterium]|nr:sporulation protein YqfD [Bacilli bacterium]